MADSVADSVADSGSDGVMGSGSGSGASGSVQVPVGLIACDMDGTLLAADGRVSERNSLALRRARDAGWAVAVATGRSQRTALPRLGPVSPVQWAVCSNGAMEVEVGTARVVRVDPLPADVVVELVAALSEVPGVEFAWEDLEVGLECSPGFLRRHPTIETAIVRDGSDRPAVPTGPQVKVLLSLADKVRVEAVEAVRPLLPAGVEVATSGSLFTEVTAAGVDKAFGLARLAERLGVDRGDVVAFGDNHNDVPMLRWAGRSVAMANSDPVAFEAAGERTLDHDEDGVAAVVEELVAGA